MEPYARLFLKLEDGQEYEYELAAERLTLGRSSQSDVVLPDANVSRNHARIEYGPDGCILTDLESVNGTFVNAAQVRKIRLKPGDMIQIGDSHLRFEAARPADPIGVTQIDSVEDLDNTLIQNTVSMTINDTSVPRVVVHTGDLTWEVPLIGDQYTIGRGDEVDIHIPQARISREHARIERSGDGFLIRDLGSGNGTWIGAEEIESRPLQDGDTFRVGGARLIFKAPFTADDLADNEAILRTAGPRKPIIVVPGIMGSKLGRGGIQVWPNVRILFTDRDVFRLPDKEPMEVLGILDEVVVVPNLIRMEQYNRLGDFLVDGLGYTRGVDLIEFGYDWRYDVRLAARKLGEVIENWNVDQPITIIAHSLGTLVSRYYVERLGGKKRVRKLNLLGGPHRGVPKAVASLLAGPDILPMGLMGDRMREIMVSFPTMYQILPVYPCARDQYDEPINLLEDDRWVPEEHRHLIRDARDFRAELGNRSSVPTLSIFGYGNSTVMGIRVERRSDGSFAKFRFEAAEQGDDSIPEHSAILEGSDIHPVRQSHGSLFVDNDVKMRLKVELTKPYG